VKRLLILTVCIAVVGVAVNGCAESASTKAKNACLATGTHTGLECAEAGLHVAEYGSLRAYDDAKHTEEIQDEAAEVEEVLKRERAEETAHILRSMR
jgi:hypothetical protein